MDLATPTVFQSAVINAIVLFYLNLRCDCLLSVSTSQLCTTVLVGHVLSDKRTAPSAEILDIKPRFLPQRLLTFMCT